MALAPAVPIIKQKAGDVSPTDNGLDQRYRGSIGNPGLAAASADTTQLAAALATQAAIKTADHHLESSYEGSDYDSSIETSSSPMTPISDPSTPQTDRLSVFRFNRTAWLVTTAVIGLILLIGSGGLFLSKINSRVKTANTQASGLPSAQYAVGDLPLQGLSLDAPLAVTEASRLAVNGQLQVNNTFVLTPGRTPDSPVTGQIYYDKTSNQPYFYNGAQFVSLDPVHVTSIGSANGVIALGQGLQLSGNQLSVSSTLLQTIANAGLVKPAVTSLQGLSGALTLTAGNGVAITGMMITNSGVVGLSSSDSSINITAADDGVYDIKAVPTSGAAAIELAPVTVQADATNRSTQHIDKTGSGVYLEYASNGVNTFVVSQTGQITTGTINYSQVLGTPTVVGSIGGVSGILSLGSGLVVAGNTVSNSGVTGLTGTANQINVSSAAGNVSLSLPQAINTMATPTFSSETLGLAGSTSGSLIFANNGNLHLTNLQAQASATQNQTIVIPASTAITDTICLTTLGNCAGPDNDVTTSGGLTNAIPMFSAAQNVTNSSITDDGTTVTVGNVLSAATFTANLIQSTGALNIAPGGDLAVGAINHTLSLRGNGNSTLAVTVGSSTSTLGFVAPTANRSINLPDETGTICTTGSVCSGYAPSSGSSSYAPSTGGFGYLQLQASSPGTAQTGNANVTGTVIAGTFSGSGASLTSLNATNVASGTVADARLTTNVTLQGNTFNGASKLVQLNASSQLPAISGVNLTNLNGSNIASGTVADARLTANVTLQGNTFNGASQLVQLTAGGLLPILNGSNLTNISTSSLSGTIADGSLSTNVTLQGNSFNGASQLVQLNASTQLPAISGVNLTNLNGTNIASGAVADARLSTNVTVQGNIFNGISQLVQTTAGGILPVISGANLTSLNGTNISSGTVADARLSANVALLNATGPQIFTGNNNFTGTVLSRNGVDSIAAFQVQNTAGAAVLTTDTTNARVGIGTATPTATLDIASPVLVPTGPELITNGTFTGGTTGWTLGSNVAYGTNDVVSTYAGGDPSLSTTFDTVAGNTYILTFTVSSANASMMFWLNNNYNPYNYGPFPNGLATAIFKATFTGVETIAFDDLMSHKTGDTWTLDNVSIKQTQDIVNPLKVTGSDGTTWLSLGGDLTGNIALGYLTLQANTTGTGNTANGANALQYNTTGSYNSAIGSNALQLNTTGVNNTATGNYSLIVNTIGYSNTATGVNSLYNNVTGSENTATGVDALQSNITGSSNTANGVLALQHNTTGTLNAAIGYLAGANLTTGSNNVAIGSNTVFTSATGSNQLQIGAGVSGDLALGTLTVKTITNTTSAFQVQNTAGTAVLTTDTTNARVGIGTAAPTASLEVNNITVPTGPELITNGTFTGGTTAWTLGNNVAYGTNNVVSTYTGGAGNPSLHTTFASVAGNTYMLTFTISAANAPSYLWLWNGSNPFNSGPFTNGTFTVFFKADFTGTESIYFDDNDYSVGDTWTLDNVSIKQTTNPFPALKVTGYDGATWLSLGGDINGNTALGDATLQANTTGIGNTATGSNALQSNTTGYNNTATGLGAQYVNTTGYNNTASGTYALYSNTAGSANTATGVWALSYLKTLTGTISATTTNAGNARFTSTSTTGLVAGATITITGTTNYNGAKTVLSVDSSTTFTIATAYSSADSNGHWSTINADSNTALGAQAGKGTMPYAAIGNSLFGYNAGSSLQTGANYNTFVGYGTGYNITTGTNNLLLGYNAGNNLTTGSSNVLIGQGVVAASPAGSNQLQIGAGISGDLALGTLQVKTVTNSTTGFQIQNTASVALFTADTSGMVITVAGTASSFASLTLTNAHFKSTQTTAPVVGTPASCGTTPTAAIQTGSTDSAGSFRITAGTGSPTTCDTILTFNKAYGAAPKSIMVVAETKDGGTGTAAARQIYVSASTTTSFTVKMNSAPAASEVDWYYYWVVE